MDFIPSPLSKPKIIDLSVTPKTPNASLADVIFMAYASGGGQEAISAEGIDWTELWSALDTNRSIRIVTPVTIGETVFTIRTDEVTVVYMDKTPAMLAYNFMMNYDGSLTQVKVVLNYQGTDSTLLTVVVDPVAVPTA